MFKQISFKLVLKYFSFRNYWTLEDVQQNKKFDWLLYLPLFVKSQTVFITYAPDTGYTILDERKRSFDVYILCH